MRHDGTVPYTSPSHKEGFVPYDAVEEGREAMESMDTPVEVGREILWNPKNLPQQKYPTQSFPPKLVKRKKSRE